MLTMNMNALIEPISQDYIESRQTNKAILRTHQSCAID